VSAHLLPFANALPSSPKPRGLLLRPDYTRRCVACLLVPRGCQARLPGRGAVAAYTSLQGDLTLPSRAHSCGQFWLPLTRGGIVCSVSSRFSPLRGARVVVTAGPTREYLDDIRFLSNASTGRMGFELARAAARRGALVTLILGPSALPALRGVETVHIVSTKDLLEATREAANDADVLLFAAAPSDFRPQRRRKGKPPRKGAGFDLALRATPDVAATLGRRKGSRLHIGFALEVSGGAARARRKLERKRLDAIVLNSARNLGKGGGEASWIPAEGSAEALPTTSKGLLARSILDRVERELRQRR